MFPSFVGPNAPNPGFPVFISLAALGTLVVAIAPDIIIAYPQAALLLITSDIAHEQYEIEAAGSFDIELIEVS